MTAFRIASLAVVALIYGPLCAIGVGLMTLCPRAGREIDEYLRRTQRPTRAA